MGEGSFGKVYKRRGKFIGQTDEDYSGSANPQSGIRVLVDNGTGGPCFRRWVALADISSQVLGYIEDAPGKDMFEYMACITVMLTRAEQLKSLFSTPALQEVPTFNETMKQILDHAKTSGLVDQLCLCLATAGVSIKGTTIGVVLYNRGIMAFADSRSTIIYQRTNRVTTVKFWENFGASRFDQPPFLQ